jgi:hypothetical protein
MPIQLWIDPRLISGGYELRSLRGSFLLLQSGLRRAGRGRLKMLFVSSIQEYLRGEIE